MSTTEKVLEMDFDNQLAEIKEKMSSRFMLKEIEQLQSLLELLAEENNRLIEENGMLKKLFPELVTVIENMGKATDEYERNMSDNVIKIRKLFHENFLKSIGT